MLLEDQIYFIDACDHGINAKLISMCSFFEAEIFMRGVASRENCRLSETAHIDKFTVISTQKALLSTNQSSIGN